MSNATGGGEAKAAPSTPFLFIADLILADGELHRDWAVLVQDGGIVEVGPRTRLDRPEARVAAFPGRVLLPGCVNAHAHSPQSLLRGIGDDRPFPEWRATSLFAHLPSLTPEAVYAGALFAYAEMLLAGATTACDFFYLHHGGNDHARQAIRAARDLGLRLVLARAFYDWKDGPKAFRETVNQARDRWQELRKETAGDARVTVIPAPHSLHAASEEMIRAGAACASEAGSPWHVHVAEQKSEVEACKERYGATPLRALDRMGVLDERAVLVHAVWLDGAERRLCGERKAAVVHCPAANMFLGDGVCDVADLRERGVTVALGTDGGCANSRQSVFDEMRTAALLQKVHRHDAGGFRAETALEMGTAAGGAALGLPVGRLAAGCRADFTLLDLEDLSLHPIRGLTKNLVYSMTQRAIRDVVVEGETVVKDRQLAKVPVSTVRARVKEAVKALEAAG